VTHALRPLMVAGAALALLAGPASAAPALAARPAPPKASPPAILHVGQIDRQDIGTRGGCEPDTLVEPDVAVSPFNSQIMIAVAHDCRFATGGAVDISYAWTHDGGAHWHHAPVPGLTRAVGGVWARASDPVVAFGPDGSVYISSLVFDLGCPSGVAVSKSTDGGATFHQPVLAHKSTTCAFSDDKNWLVVDTQPASPFYGRIYQFWTAFLSTKSGNSIGSPQVVRWSDDGGAHWSATHLVTPRDENSQGSQPMIQPDGAITDVYQFFGTQSAHGHGVPAITREHPARWVSAAGGGPPLVARTSFDGGATWTSRAVISSDVGFGPGDIRCCLAAATVDPIRGTMYAVWEGAGPGQRDPVMISSSADGRHWSRPVVLTPHDGATIQHVNAAVAAYNGKVFVDYGIRNTAIDNGNLVQQELSSSFNGGATFGKGVSLGPVSNLRFAAVAGGKFPGDYIGASVTASRLALVWCVSSRPANPVRVYHQVLFAAVLRP
jgi:hypothetical protein